MLVEIHSSETIAVKRLVKAWAQLYQLNPAALPIEHTTDWVTWVEAASAPGRAVTIAKLNERLVRIRCQIAGIETSDLYSYMPQVLDCGELRQLAEVSLTVYQQLLELYQQHAPSDGSGRYVSSSSAASAWSIPDIEQFARALEPKLLEFQLFHTRAKDWRAIGFLTTQLNFCNRWLLKSLTPPEQYLLAPYLRFVEEYVAHPWHQVCASAAHHGVVHPSVILVERMIPGADEVAQAVYQQLATTMSHHVSHRGKLNHPGVQHSCLRDVKMFQAYLWLCVLKQSMTPIETELVRLCLMVLPSIGVKWDLVKLWVDLLVGEIINRVTPIELNLILPYTTGMQHAFLTLYYPEATS